jgi:lysophospholipase L1-like esterase
MRIRRLTGRLSVVVFIVAVVAAIFWSVGPSWLWYIQISKYEREDRRHPPRPGCVVFTGSSSIRLWHTLSEDMKPLDAINRGFGGSQLSQLNAYASRIVIPYRPSAVVVYAGENDLSWPWSKSAETVLSDFQEFVTIVHAALPDTWIYYVSMKPDPLRERNWPTLDRTNRMIADYCRTADKLQFIDVSAAMLDAQGKPRRELYRPDGLHMNSQGYALWTSIIKPVLMSRFGSAPTISPIASQ